MRIRIIRGIYGHRENGRIVEKSPRHGAFDVSSEEGVRLISLGIAERAGTDKAVAEGQEEEDGGEQKEDNVIPNYGNGFPEPLEEMRIEELRRIAGEMGLKKNGRKEELAERIRESLEMEEEEDEEDDEGEMPELNPAEVE